MEIVFIVAIAEGGVIGNGNVIPWRLKADMQRLKSLTMGKPVVMGRKTWLSLAIRPLPRRTNIVVTRDPAFTALGVLVASGLDPALQAARGDALRRGADAIMVIGGGDIYAQAMPFADRLEITQIHASPQGDVRFPAIDPALWHESTRESHAAGPDDNVGFDFVTYLKKSRQATVN